MLDCNKNIALLFDVKLTSLVVGNLTSNASDMRISGEENREEDRRDVTKGYISEQRGEEKRRDVLDESRYALVEKRREQKRCIHKGRCA